MKSTCSWSRVRAVRMVLLPRTGSLVAAIVGQQVGAHTHANHPHLQQLTVTGPQARTDAAVLAHDPAHVSWLAVAK